MTEVVSPVLPLRYNDETAFYDVAVDDPSVGIYFVPDGYVARLHAVLGWYEQDGGGSNMEVNLELATGYEDALGTVPIKLFPLITPVVGGFCRFLWSREIENAYTSQEVPGSNFQLASYSPLPNITLGPEGRATVGFNHCTRLVPDTYMVELFPSEGKSASGGANADLYLLPALG